MEGVKGNFTIHDDKEMFLPFFVDKPGEPVNEMLYSSQKKRWSMCICLCSIIYGIRRRHLKSE